MLVVELLFFSQAKAILSGYVAVDYRNENCGFISSTVDGASVTTFKVL